MPTMEMRYKIGINAPLISREAKTLMVEGDRCANTIVIEVMDGNEPANLAGCSVCAYMIRADGQKPFVHGTVEGNIVTVCLNEGFYAVPGRYNLFVRLTSTDDTKRTLLWLNGWINDEGQGDVIDTEGVVPDLDDLLAQIEAMEQATAAANEALEKLPYTSTEEQTHYLLENTDIDPTLSENGKVADAGVVGEWLKNQNASITLLKGNVWNAVEHGCANDGSSDCSAIVQAAIDAVDGGIVLFFPKGKYLFTNRITVRNKQNITICGVGASWNNCGTMFMINYKWAFLGIYGGNGITVRDLLMYGYDLGTNTAIAYSDDTPETMDCRCTNTLVENVAIQNFYRGINVWCPSGYNTFRDVRIRNIAANGWGINIGSGYANTGLQDGLYHIYPNYIYIDGCKIDGMDSTKATAIYVNAAWFVYVQNCDLCNFVDSMAISVVNNNAVAGEITDIYITNNALFNNKMGIRIVSQSELHGIKQCSIIGNAISGVINDDTVDCMGIRISKAASANKDVENVNVIGNTFRTQAHLTNLIADGVNAGTYYAAGAGV